MQLEYKRIVVAVDGSDAAERAFAKAVDIAQRNGAQLILSHVIDNRTFATAESYDRHLVQRADSYAKQLLKSYKAKAEQCSLTDIITDTEYGSPKIKIAKDVAKKYQADLIICGATGLNAMERFLIGSVSESITRHASCDVLVVRNKQ